jgi:hypothetical protein
MKKPTKIKQPKEDLSYEKDPRFIEFIKKRAELADNPKNRTPWSVVRKEIKSQYGDYRTINQHCQ